MNTRSSVRIPRAVRLPAAERAHAAREALAICESAEALARAADDSLSVDDDRLFSLLEQREQLLADLAEHVVSLRLERPTADSQLFAATERAVDEADALVTDVCTALNKSHGATMALAMRVSDRADALRAELAAVQQAGSARIGYGVLPTSHQLDNLG